MQYLLRKLSAAILVLSFITACSSDDDTVTVTQTTPAETTSTETTPAGTTPTAFVGSWTTGCISSPNSSARVETYRTYDLQFEAATWQFIQSGYFDESCTIQSQVTTDTTSMSATTTTAMTATITITGTYLSSAEVVTTSDGLQAYTLSLTADTSTNTLNESGENEASGITRDILVHVDTANILYVDAALLGVNQAPGTLALAIPFDRAP